MVGLMRSRSLIGFAISCGSDRLRRRKSLVSNAGILFSRDRCKQPPKITGCENVALESVAFELDMFARKLWGVIGANTSGIVNLIQLS